MLIYKPYKVESKKPIHHHEFSEKSKLYRKEKLLPEFVPDV